MVLLYISSHYLWRGSVAAGAPLRSTTGLHSRVRQVAAFASPSSAAGSSANNKLVDRTPKSLRNEYWVLRHGQSKANVAQVIASSPVIATQKYGLSDLGKEQAALAGEEVIQAFEASQQTNAVLLLTSDLLRARETAEIVQQKLQKAGIPLYENPTIIGGSIKKGLVVETRLRERWFGEWDEMSDENYPKVWKEDLADPNHVNHGVESVNQVVERTTECITEWDGVVEGCFVTCVAHGDVLQILQTAFAKMDGAQHRSLEHLETAKLRRIELAE